jgi:hypothetical protein
LWDFALDVPEQLTLPAQISFDSKIVVPFAPDPQIRFDYPIAMGVRFGEKEWQGTLDQWIAGHKEKIEAILREYGVPLLDQ